jgi:curved DNA-binding protein CbpA
MKTKKSHYEQLGVKPDASPNEIKKARRRAAERAHPDKGGDQAEMASINHAFDVLIDPRRRLLYDRTGEDHQQPEREAVRAIITQVFADGLAKDVPHILNHAKDLLKQGNAVLEQQIDAVTKQRNKLQAKRDKIATKTDENVFRDLVDAEIRKCEQNIASAEFDLEICVKASKELGKYKSSEEVPSYTMSDLRMGQQWASTSTAGGF